nr:probable LRR receptor-like serine/threonine-protein kinase At1g56140 isoform X2 [Ipomoea trifida]
MLGHLTEKADVFSFGVVVLEIVSGRSNSDSNLEQDKRYLLEWVEAIKKISEYVTHLRRVWKRTWMEFGTLLLHEDGNGGMKSGHEVIDV